MSPERGFRTSGVTIRLGGGNLLGGARRISQGAPAGAPDWSKGDKHLYKKPPRQEKTGYQPPDEEDDRIGWRVDIVENYNNAGDLGIILQFAGIGLTKASFLRGRRYLEDGEVQYLFTFISDCGIAYRFDHLATLSTKFAEIANKFPKAVPDDSRTTPINPGVSVTVGEVVATAVGFAKTKNVSFDFGVYNLRQRNQASKDPSWAKRPKLANSQAPYAICWFDLLPPADSTRIKNLPATGVEGKTSDYCKP